MTFALQILKHTGHNIACPLARLISETTPQIVVVFVFQCPGENFIPVQVGPNLASGNDTTTMVCSISTCSIQNLRPIYELPLLLEKLF
jgi:hypothetical protein